MYFNEEKVNEILKKYKNAEANKKYKEHYEDASQRAEFNYFMSHLDTDQDYDIIECQKKYRDEFSGSDYTEEEFVKMMLTCKILATILKVKSKNFGKKFWLKFNSPPEVQCYRILCEVWNSDLIEINGSLLVLNKENKVDFILRDIQGRIILVIEVQGRGHEKEKQKEKDKKRASDFKKAGIPFIQLKGKDVKNNFVGVGKVIVHFIAEFELFKEENIVVLAEKNHQKVFNIPYENGLWDEFVEENVWDYYDYYDEEIGLLEFPEF